MIREKTANAEKMLEKLISIRSKNIQTLSNEWTIQDFADMRAAYETSLDVAASKGDQTAIKIANEKICQLNEAWNLKQLSFQENTSSIVREEDAQG